MTWKDALLGYRPGRQLADGEPIIQSAMARLIVESPTDYTIEQMSQLAYMPPFDEHLVLTPNYLVYKTDYELLGAIKKAFTFGANTVGPAWAGPMMKVLMSCIDTDDQSFWLPHQGIRESELQVFQGETAGLFGTRLVRCYWYEFSLEGGTLWFLQRGQGERNAEKQFSRMAAAIDDLSITEHRRSA